MKRKQTHLLMLVLLMAFVASPAAAQKPGAERTLSGSDVSTVKAQPSEARGASNAAESLRVTVSADSWTGNFVTYRSGENFVVVVPQAKTSAIRWNLAGQGLGGVQVDQRGDDVVVLLRVSSDNEPSVHQEGNRLNIVFAAPSAVTRQESTKESPVIRSADTTTVSNGNGRGGTRNLPAQPAGTAQPAGPLTPSLPQGGLTDLALALLKKNTTADALNLDLSVPEAPAFTVLGLNPQTVVRPATPQEFATSLINGLDQNGNFQNGLAIDTAPYMLFNGENVKIRDYMDQYLTRLLSRAQFSFAAVKGASKDDLTTRLAMGMNLTLWDRGDPRIYRPGEEGDVLDCFVRKLDPTTPVPPDVIGDAEKEAAFVAPMLAKLKPEADQCRADGQKARWNRSAWTIAYAPSWISKTGKSSDFKWNGGALWTSLAYGFEEVPSLRKIGQVIFHARYRSREQVPDENNPGKFLTQNTFFFGGRFRAGSPKFAFNIEDGFLRTKTLGGKTDSSNRFSVGAELRLTDDLYFVISTGGNAGGSDGKSHGFVMSSFKYGFNKKSQLNPQPQ
jgi:hypothetical protein